MTAQTDWKLSSARYGESAFLPEPDFCPTKDYTDQTNCRNVDAVRKQIARKLDYSLPFLPTAQMAARTVNDMDDFPYNRFFRGVYYKQHPVVFEREAGWRPREDKCYQPVCFEQPGYYPNHCFEGPCSVVFPCYPGFLRKYADKEELEVMLNRTCVAISP